MIHHCLACGQDFEVTADDLAFLDRVSPVIGDRKFPIPPPTHCPDCRQQRRLTYRNERTFYRRHCSLCQRSIIALYPADAPCPVYCESCYWGVGWDPLTYGQAFDPSKNFFEQFALLQRTVPHLFFSSTTNVNSEYCNHASGMKDCYLVHGSMDSEDCYHGTRFFRCRDCCDSSFLNDCEVCYECVNCDECYDLQHAYHCVGCRSSRYLEHCQGCRDCLFCINRRQATFQVLNEELSQAEFQKIRHTIETDPAILAEFLRQYEALKHDSLVPCRIVDQAEQCTGNYIRQSERCRSAFDVQKCQDVTHGYDCGSLQDCHDVYSVYGPGELCYELYSSHHVHHTLFSHDCWPADELLHCDHCFGCSHCFGCLGMQKKQYCVLNRQYTKEEYERLVPKIIERMRSNGEWGEFFPIAISPFAYNETTANEYFPMTKEEATARGWRWREVVEESPIVTRTINADDLPISIADIPDDVVNWAIACPVSRRPYKIIKQELEFYRRHHIPLPHLHPDERHRKRMQIRGPRKLWQRGCCVCAADVMTSYAPERPERIGCESCYLQSVY